jgi:hypothetical protein
VSCYMRHMEWVLDALGLENDKANRKLVDNTIRDVLGFGEGSHCPEVWAAIKALPEAEKANLPAEIASRGVGALEGP